MVLVELPLLVKVEVLVVLMLVVALVEIVQHILEIQELKILVVEEGEQELNQMRLLILAEQAVPESSSSHILHRTLPKLSTLLSKPSVQVL